MHAEVWCDRNRRPMGLYYAVPFLSRPMNREEIEYHHFNIRLCYHQYEDWDKLIYAEEQEAGELDKENPGSGKVFLEKLKGFTGTYSLAEQKAKPTVITEPLPDNGESAFLKMLVSKGSDLTAQEVGEMLRSEQDGPKRLSILILLRELYKNLVLPPEEKVIVTEKLISHKVIVSQERTRRNFVRRVYKQNKLFALEEIKSRYPDYHEAMLYVDLRQTKNKLKKKKHKPVLDLRRRQLQKLAFRIQREDLSPEEYHHTCCRMVMLQNAHDCRAPIPLTVSLNRETLVYSFAWRTRESVVKSFVSLANTKGITHDWLKEKHREMVNSNYSY
jgi:transcription initiation factor IIE alpha subunit